MPITSPAPQTFAELLAQALTEPGTIHDAYTAFHGYSLGNQVLALMECAARGIQPGPIATFPRWKDRGRFVRKGEKALTLCMPITVKRRQNEATGDDETEVFTKFVYAPALVRPGADRRRRLPGGHARRLGQGPRARAVRHHRRTLRAPGRQLPGICPAAKRRRQPHRRASLQDARARTRAHRPGTHRRGCTHRRRAHAAELARSGSGIGCDVGLRRARAARHRIQPRLHSALAPGRRHDPRTQRRQDFQDRRRHPPRRPSAGGHPPRRRVTGRNRNAGRRAGLLSQCEALPDESHNTIE